MNSEKTIGTLSLVRKLLTPVIALALGALLSGPGLITQVQAGPVVIDGTDANDHGSTSGGVNLQGWLYMQKVLENLAPQVGNGNKIVVDLGTVSGSQARSAIDSAFSKSTLPGLGWTIVHFTTAADITSFFTSNTVAGVNLATAGIIYVPTYGNTAGDLASGQVTAINAGATAIATFVGGAGNPFAGGGLFSMAENGTGAYGWLSTLIPGISVVQGGDGTPITLTADGTAAFPGLTSADLSAGPWHDDFAGNFGSLKVLGTAPSAGTTRSVILGGGASTVISEIKVTPAVATNEVGTSHTVCASLVVVTNGSTNVIVGSTVSFNVTNGPNAGVSGTSVSDSNGLACFTYVGTGGVGIDIINVSFTDAGGKVHSGSAIKVWVQPSNLPPTAICKGSIVVSADSLTCTASVSADDVDNGSSDPDAGDSITNKTLIPPGPYPIGSNSVILVVTDTHGASNSCSATILVQDTTPPNISCPSNIVQNTDPGVCSAVVSYSVTASDTCGASAINVNVYSGFSDSGGGTPYSGLAGSFGANGVSFATDTGYNWHPFGLGAFGADITGCLNVATDDIYSFSLSSDDGSLLYIDGNLVVDNGGPHSPAVASGNALLLAGLHTFEVQFFEDFGGSSGVDLGLPAGVTYASCGLPVTCTPPSGSSFPKGTNTVVCCATDASGNTNCCSFTVTVEDKEAPVAACREATNPSGEKIPTAGKNPKSGQNPDGFYQLLGKDNCDSNPASYVQDSITGFLFGPFANGDIVKITQSNHDTIRPMAGVVVAHIQLVGDALCYAVDADGNVGAAVSCLVPKPPK